MISRFGYTYFKEIREAEHSAGCGKTTTRVAPYPHVRSIDVGILLCQLAYAGNLVGQGILSHIAIAHIMETFRAQRIAGAFYLYHHKTELGECITIATRCCERPVAHAAALRPG